MSWYLHIVSFNVAAVGFCALGITLYKLVGVFFINLDLVLVAMFHEEATATNEVCSSYANEP